VNEISRLPPLQSKWFLSLVCLYWFSFLLISRAGRNKTLNCFAFRRAAKTLFKSFFANEAVGDVCVANVSVYGGCRSDGIRQDCPHILIKVVRLSLCSFRHNRDFMLQLLQNKSLELKCVHIRLTTTIIVFGFVLLYWYHYVGERFHYYISLSLNCPDLRGPPSFQFNGCQVSFLGVKRPGLDADHSPPSCTDIKNA
jgi:hypothetical protein